MMLCVITWFHTPLLSVGAADFAHHIAFQFESCSRWHRAAWALTTHAARGPLASGMQSRRRVTSVVGTVVISVCRDLQRRPRYDRHDRTCLCSELCCAGNCIDVNSPNCVNPNASALPRG